MPSINRVIIAGHLGGDPEVKPLNNSSLVAGFSMATTEKWTDRNTGEVKEKTEWHKVVCFGKLASLCEQYLKKGSPLLVEGKLETKKWTDKSGQEKYTTQINAKNIHFLGNNNKDNKTVSMAKNILGTQEGDEIPF